MNQGQPLINRRMKVRLRPEALVVIMSRSMVVAVVTVDRLLGVESQGYLP